MPSPDTYAPDDFYARLKADIEAGLQHAFEAITFMADTGTQNDDTCYVRAPFNRRVYRRKVLDLITLDEPAHEGAPVLDYSGRKIWIVNVPGGPARIGDAKRRTAFVRALRDYLFDKGWDAGIEYSREV